MKSIWHINIIIESKSLLINTLAITINFEMGIKKASSFDEAFSNLAERTGLEPATPGVTGRYSNQLNYRSKFFSI